MMKKFLSLVLALVMVLGTFSFVYADEAETPAETTATEHDERIQWLIDQGLVAGYGDGDYGLEREITRAEMAAMIVRAQGLEAQAEASKGRTKFSDVPAAHWASGYVNVASGNNFVAGYPDGTFKPADNVKYQDVIVMLVRANANNIPGMIVGGKEVPQSYPYGYIKKAAEVGMLDDIDIKNYADAAVRQNAFYLIYNAVHNIASGNFGRNVAFKAIVARNSRTERLNKDEIEFRVLEVPTQDKTSVDTKLERQTYRPADLYKFVLPEKYGDPDQVLGKVFDVSLDKKGNITNLKEDKGYEVKYGVVTFADQDKFGINWRNYTVNYRRDYNHNENRITDTFVNNRDYSYINSLPALKGDQRFARITVKNGVVFFIDAFVFNDIAPMKEMDANARNAMAYNDTLDGKVTAFAAAGRSVLGYTTEKGIYRLDPKDITANDVIHQYNTGTGTGTAWSERGLLVRQDAKFEGTFNRVFRDQYNDHYAKVKVGEEEQDFYIATEGPWEPVFSYAGTEYRTLHVRNDQTVLRHFYNQPVTVLEDICGNLQLLKGDVMFHQGVTVVDQILANAGRFVKPNNDRAVLTATLNTYISEYDIIKQKRSTSTQRLYDLNRGDLVFTDGPNEGTMAQLVRLADYIGIQETAIPVDKFTTGHYAGEWDMSGNYIKVGGKRYQVLDRTNVFVLHLSDKKQDIVRTPGDGKEPKVSKDIYRVNAVSGVKLADVKAKARTTTPMKAFIITDELFSGLIKQNIIRYYDTYRLTDKPDVAHTIVLIDTELKSVLTEEVIWTRGIYTATNVHEITSETGKVYKAAAPAATGPDYDFRGINIADVVRLFLDKEGNVARWKIEIPSNQAFFKVVGGDILTDSTYGARRIKLEDANGRVQEYWVNADAFRFGATVRMGANVQVAFGVHNDIWAYVVKAFDKKPDAVHPILNSSVEATIKAIAALTEVKDITAANVVNVETAAKAARGLYNALKTEEEKKAVYNIQKLMDVEKKIDEVYTELAKPVNEELAKLPAVSSIIDAASAAAAKAAAEKAQKAYDALLPGAKAKVDAKLLAKIKEIMDAVKKFEDEMAAVTKINEDIQKLIKIDIKDKASAQEAKTLATQIKTAYEALSPAAKAKVVDYDKVKPIYDQAEQMLADYKVVENLVAEINAINPDEITTPEQAAEARKKVEAIEKKIADLTPAQKALYDKETEAKAHLQKIKDAIDAADTGISGKAARDGDPVLGVQSYVVTLKNAVAKEITEIKAFRADGTALSTFTYDKAAVAANDTNTFKVRNKGKVMSGDYMEISFGAKKIKVVLEP